MISLLHACMNHYFRRFSCLWSMARVADASIRLVLWCHRCVPPLGLYVGGIFRALRSVPYVRLDVVDEVISAFQSAVDLMESNLELDEDDDEESAAEAEADSGMGDDDSASASTISTRATSDGEQGDTRENQRSKLLGLATEPPREGEERNATHGQYAHASLFLGSRLAVVGCQTATARITCAGAWT